MEQSRANIGARCAPVSLPPLGCVRLPRERPGAVARPCRPQGWGSPTSHRDVSRPRSLSARGPCRGDPPPRSRLCGVSPRAVVRRWGLRCLFLGSQPQPRPRPISAERCPPPLRWLRPCGPSFPQLASHQGPSPGPAHFCCPSAGSRCDSYPRT